MHGSFESKAFFKSCRESSLVPGSMPSVHGYPASVALSSCSLSVLRFDTTIFFLSAIVKVTHLRSFFCLSLLKCSSTSLSTLTPDIAAQKQGADRNATARRRL